MPKDRILVRKNEDDQLMVFVPTKAAPKDFVKQWVGGAEYIDTKLSVYEDTKPAEGQEAQRMYEEYRRVTGATNAYLGERMPRNYQSELDPIHTEGAPGEFEASRNKEGFWDIRDSTGQVIAFCSTLEMAKKRMAQLRDQEISHISWEKEH